MNSFQFSSIIWLVRSSIEHFLVFCNDRLSFRLVKRGINSKDYFLITIQIPFLHRINSILSANILNFKYS